MKQMVLVAAAAVSLAGISGASGAAPGWAPQHQSTTPASAARNSDSRDVNRGSNGDGKRTYEDSGRNAPPRIGTDRGRGERRTTGDPRPQVNGEGAGRPSGNWKTDHHSNDSRDRPNPHWSGDDHGGRSRDHGDGGDHDHDRARNHDGDWNGAHWRDDHGRDWQHDRAWYDHYRGNHYRYYGGHYFARQRFFFGLYYAPFPYYRTRFWVSDAWLPGAYYETQYVIGDYWRFDLYDPPAGCQWVRVGGDALLVDTWSGEVIDHVYDFFW